jgi:ABC-type antimicrobial peptide transport system permease subunit
MTYKASILIKYFLDNLFLGAVAILVLLAMLLIYSLMLQNVSEKTYEYGMLRALGLKMHELSLVIAI